MLVSHMQRQASQKIVRKRIRQVLNGVLNQLKVFHTASKNRCIGNAVPD